MQRRVHEPNLRTAAATDIAGVAHDGSRKAVKSFEVVRLLRPAAADFEGEWAIVDSNHGPPPYQSGALTD